MTALLHRIGTCFWFAAFLLLTLFYFCTHPSAWKADLDAANKSRT